MGGRGASSGRTGASRSTAASRSVAETNTTRTARPAASTAKGRTVGARRTSGNTRLNTAPPTTADTRDLEVYYQRSNMTMKQRIKDIDRRIKEVNRSGTWQPDVVDSLAELKEYYREIDGR